MNRFNFQSGHTRMVKFRDGLAATVNLAIQIVDFTLYFAAEQFKAINVTQIVD